MELPLRKLPQNILDFRVNHLCRWLKPRCTTTACWLLLPYPLTIALFHWKNPIFSAHSTPPWLDGPYQSLASAPHLSWRAFTGNIRKQFTGLCHRGSNHQPTCPKVGFCWNLQETQCGTLWHLSMIKEPRNSRASPRFLEADQVNGGTAGCFSACLSSRMGTLASTKMVWGLGWFRDTPMT